MAIILYFINNNFNFELPYCFSTITFALVINEAKFPRKRLLGNKTYIRINNNAPPEAFAHVVGGGRVSFFYVTEISLAAAHIITFPGREQFLKNCRRFLILCTRCDVR